MRGPWLQKVTSSNATSYLFIKLDKFCKPYIFNFKFNITQEIHFGTKFKIRTKSGPGKDGGQLQEVEDPIFVCFSDFAVALMDHINVMIQQAYNTVTKPGLQEVLQVELSFSFHLSEDFKVWTIRNIIMTLTSNSV